jgi:hypothetical protein
MKHVKSPKHFIVLFAVLFAVQIACLTGGGNEVSNNDAPDYAATEAALQSTQAALDAQAEKPEPTDAPEPTDTSEPPPPADPTTPPETYSSGDIIYFTDFDGPEDWEDGWIHFSVPDADYSAYKDNGVMYVEVPETYTTVYLFQDELFFEREFADVYVEAGFENLSTHNINQIGIMCRGTDKGWYEFNILSGGLWYIYRYNADNGRYTLLKDGGIPNLVYDAPHTVGAYCIGNELTIYFDGEPLRNGTITDSQFRDGQVGLSVFAGDWADVIVEFDYFGVQLP